jgi:negative regulator of flagellin synthesis FlgM
MAINLGGIGLGGTPAGTAREAQEAQQPAAATPDGGGQDSAAARPGEVSITSTAALLASLEQALGKQAPVDQKRVEGISRAIADGSYKVDSAKIAAGLMQSERSLAPLPLMEI